MTLDQLNELLETYGCNENQWPTNVREQYQNLIARSPEAKALLEQHRALEEQLSSISVPEFAGLEQKVLHQTLPAREAGMLDRLVNWLIPANETPGKLLRPAFAACLPLVLGIVVGNFYHFGYDSISDGFQYWDDELLMLSFSDYNESGIVQ